jgi:hypothetical protein
MVPQLPKFPRGNLHNFRKEIKRVDLFSSNQYVSQDQRGIPLKVNVVPTIPSKEALEE